MNHLGTVLANILAEENLSQRELAERCGITPTTLHSVIRHGRPCSPDTLRQLCGAVSSNLRWRYEVLLAHLRDEADRSGMDPAALLIQYRDGGSFGISEPLGVTFGLLAHQAAEDPALKRLLDSLVEVGLRRQAVEVDRAGSGAVNASTSQGA